MRGAEGATPMDDPDTLNPHMIYYMQYAAVTTVLCGMNYSYALLSLN